MTDGERALHGAYDPFGHRDPKNEGKGRRGFHNLSDSMIFVPGQGEVPRAAPAPAPLSEAPPPERLRPAEWNRDAGVSELIRFLSEIRGKTKDWDLMSPADRLGMLKKAEREAIFEQQQLCTDDFSYAARNYFWITDNDGRDRLFTLWESQYLILQKYYEIKAKGRAQKIYIVKSRQLGCSLLIEAMIAWRAMFHPNTEALVVSVDQPHASYLFSLMLHIYDRMPWWLKPERASREEKEGLWLDNPKPDERGIRPGMNSHVYVQWSTQFSGVGQGRKILAGHCSEITDWYQPKAKSIIEGDLLYAIKEGPEAFGFLETTGKEAGSYCHRLWRTCEKLMREGAAEWEPVFLPFFFESSRTVSVPGDWHPKKEEIAIRERVKKEWVRCPECWKYFSAALFGESRVGTICPACNVGQLEIVVLADGQLRWKEIKRRNAEEKGIDSLREHLREVASTAEEAFQIEGLAVFGPACQDAVIKTIEDPDKVPGIRVGYFDTKRRFHGVDGSKPVEGQPGVFRCYEPSCQYDHRWELDQFNVTIWRLPEPGRAYAIGVDISEGLGQDYSVIFVNKLGRAGEPDEQVAMLRDNRMEPLDLAFFCILMGNMYNDAQLAIEYNGIGKVCADAVLRVYQYPNIFRWKHLDSVNPLSNKWHWYTKPDTREKLWQTARKWIKAGSWIIRSKEFLDEMQCFSKEEDDSKSAGHLPGDHDDLLFAGMICLYCSHEGEADERGVIHVPLVDEPIVNPRWEMTCQNCGKVFGAENPESVYRCECGSIRLTGKPLERQDSRTEIPQVGYNPDGSIMLQVGSGKSSPGGLTYDSL